MSIELNNWTKNWQLVDAFFEEDEITELIKKIKRMSIHNIVYCSFENRYAKSGGLAAVTIKILPYLKQLHGIKHVILITPFYPHIFGDLGNKLEKVSNSVTLTYEGKTVKIELFRHSVTMQTEKGPETVEEYFVKAPGYFEAKNHFNDPYIYIENDMEANHDKILDNALFFAYAVPHIAKALGITKDTIFHLQEWQTALISITAKEAMLNGLLTSCATVQTMHNTFDSPLPLEKLEKIIDPIHYERYIQRIGEEKNTVYQMGLQTVDGPITIVSESFADEFTTDILQTTYFASHLQEIFIKNNIYGIRNGLFEDFPPEFAPDAHQPYNVEYIKKVKSEKREQLLELLDNYKSPRAFGKLTYKGKPLSKNLPGNVPIMIMSGRLDKGQKGFDILLHAIERFAEDEIKVILAPLPLNEEDLDYFHEITEKCSGNVLVFPFRLTGTFDLGSSVVPVYKALQMGGTYGVMPSIYEPFGAAIEYMVNGTPTIARETGGLKDQIDHEVCGFLYKELEEVYTIENIQGFIQSGGNVKERLNNPWVASMVKHLYMAIKQGLELFRDKPDDYYGLIINGLQKAQQFRWVENAREYLEVYRCVREGF